MRADDQAKLATTVHACLEYLATATSSSPLAQLAREGLLRELNALQVLLARTTRLELVPRPEPVNARSVNGRYTCPYCGGPVDQDPAIAPPPPVDPGPPMPHTWTPAELREAITQLPEGHFAGHYFDRIGQKVTGRPHVGVSLQHALELAGVIMSFGVNERGEEDPRGPYLRFRKVDR